MAKYVTKAQLISTHAPAGGATRRSPAVRTCVSAFLLTPLREGRLILRLTILINQ